MELNDRARVGKFMQIGGVRTVGSARTAVRSRKAAERSDPRQEACNPTSSTSTAVNASVNG